MGQKKKRRKLKSKKGELNKYNLYENAVQDPMVDIELLYQIYRGYHLKRPLLNLREDFCGTFLLSSKWVQINPKNTSTCIDLDSKPLQFGKKHHWKTLTENQKKRLKIINGNVLSPRSKKHQIVVAMNFSYCLFKERAQLKKYFNNVSGGLQKNGLFVLDVLGGSELLEANIEESKCVTENGQKFIYIWEQENFNILNNEAKFYMHFKPEGHRKIKKAFAYDWRAWSVPEIRDLLIECGFKNIKFFCEQDDGWGGGNGRFHVKTYDESSESWIIAISAQK